MIRVNYIVDKLKWSIYWDGKYITKHLNDGKNIKATVRTKIPLFHNEIIHFGYPALLFKYVDGKYWL